MSLDGNYDALILGTGMTQSVLSGALARVGLRVCHLDQNELYGADWGTLNLKQAFEWAQRGGPPEPPVPEPQEETKAAPEPEAAEEGYFPQHEEAEEPEEEGAEVAARQPHTLRVTSATTRAEMMARRAQLRHPAALGRGLRPVDAEEQGRHDTACVSPVFVGYEYEPRVQWRPPVPVEDMEMRSYKFAIDLSPRAVLCSGTLVDLLVKSGVGMSTEFQTVQQLQLYRDGTLWEIPCSKADVFKSKLLSAVEKRLLMKFLQFCLDWGIENISGADVTTRNEVLLASGRSLTRPQNKTTPAVQVEGFEERPFSEFLTERCRLKDRLRDLVIYAVAMLPSAAPVSTLEGLAAVYRHLSSLGRFGSSAYLFACYGVSDVIQAYCRLGAVYGATFALRMGISSFSVGSASGNITSAVTHERNKIRCRWVIGAPEAFAAFYAPGEEEAACERFVLRVSAVLAGPLDAENSRSSAIFPPDSPGIGNAEPVHVHCMGEEAFIAPQGYAVLHVSTSAPGAASEAERAAVVESLRAAMRVVVEQSPHKGGKEGVLWSMSTEQRLLRPPAALPPNAVCISAATFAFDCETATREAAELFRAHWPELDFLPKSQSAQDYENEEARSDAATLAEAVSRLAVDDDAEAVVASGPVALASAGGEGEGKTCAACTFYNPAAATECEMCGSPVGPCFPE